MSITKFDKAVSIVQSLSKEGPIKVSQEDQLYFYSHYKQATVGDVNVPRPVVLNVLGKAKWKAWKALEGTSQADAKAKYVEKLLEVLKKDDTEEGEKLIRFFLQTNHMFR